MAIIWRNVAATLAPRLKASKEKKKIGSEEAAEAKKIWRAAAWR